MRTIVTDSQGRQAEVIKEQGEQLEIRYFNNRTAFVHKSRVSMPATNHYAPAKGQLVIEAIERMKKEAEQSNTDFARGAAMAYGLVLDILKGH
jgi:D-lyxose ketol-isomerase